MNRIIGAIQGKPETLDSVKSRSDVRIYLLNKNCGPFCPKTNRPSKH